MKKNKRFAIQDRLRQINDERGDMTPALVVEDARDPDSPLHDQFDWSDTAAACKWRLHQARCLIRTVHYTTSVEGVEICVPEWIRNPDAKSEVQGYVRTETIASVESETDVARRAFAIEVDRVLANLNRARRLAVVLGFEKHLDRIIKSTERARKLVT